MQNCSDNVPSPSQGLGFNIEGLFSILNKIPFLTPVLDPNGILSIKGRAFYDGEEGIISGNKSFDNYPDVINHITYTTELSNKMLA